MRCQHRVLTQVYHANCTKVFYGEWEGITYFVAKIECTRKINGKLGMVASKGRENKGTSVNVNSFVTK